MAVERQCGGLRLSHEGSVLAVVPHHRPGKVEGGVLRGVLGLDALHLRRGAPPGFAEHLDVCVVHAAVVGLQVFGLVHGGIDREVRHVVVNRGSINTL